MPQGYQLLPQGSELSEAAITEPETTVLPTGQPLTEPLISGPPITEPLDSSPANHDTPPPANSAAAGKWEEVRADGVYRLEFKGEEVESVRGDWNPPSPQFQAWPLSCYTGTASFLKPPGLDEPTANASNSSDREGLVEPFQGRNETTSIVRDAPPAADSKPKPDGCAPFSASSTGTPVVEASVASSEVGELSSPGIRSGPALLRKCAGVFKTRRDDDDDSSNTEEEEDEEEGKGGRKVEKKMDEKDWRRQRFGEGRTPVNVVQGTGDAVLGMACVAAEGKRDGPAANGPLISEAAEGLLVKLRSAISHRVRTIPYPTSQIAGVGQGHTDRSGVEGARKTGLGGVREAVVGDGEGDKQPETTVGGLVNPEGGVDGLFGGLQGSCGGSVDGAVVASPAAVARVGVLFSGGLDSVVLAVMLAEAGEGAGRGPAVPEGEAIDLINVCFDR